MAERFEGKRLRLLTAVRDIILENGLHAASMSHISKAAGLPMGTIYNLYPTKEDLINATYVFCRENYMRSVHFLQIRSEADIEVAIKAAVIAYIDSAVMHANDYMFVEQYHLNPIIRPELLSDGGTVFGEITMSHIINRNSGKDRPVYLIQHLLLSMVHTSINLYLTGHIELTDDTKEAIAQMCWKIINE